VRFGFSDEWEWLAELFDMGFLQMDDKGSICSPPLLVYRSLWGLLFDEVS
jgi:hypothetical protein